MEQGFRDQNEETVSFHCNDTLLILSHYKGRKIRVNLCKVSNIQQWPQNEKHCIALLKHVKSYAYLMYNLMSLGISTLLLKCHHHQDHKHSHLLPRCPPISFIIIIVIILHSRDTENPSSQQILSIQYSIINCSHHPVLEISITDLSCLIDTLYTSVNISPFPRPPVSGNYRSTFCFYEFFQFPHVSGIIPFNTHYIVILYLAYFTQHMFPRFIHVRKERIFFI